MIESDTASLTDGGVSESCLEEASIEFSSEEYRPYLTDEVGQWPILKGPISRIMDPGSCQIGSEAEGNRVRTALRTIPLAAVWGQDCRWKLDRLRMRPIPWQEACSPDQSSGHRMGKEDGDSDMGCTVDTQNRKSYVHLQTSHSVQESLGLRVKVPGSQSQLCVTQGRSLVYIWASVSTFVHQGGCTRSSPRSLIF